MMMTKHIETPLNERFAAKFEVAGLRDTDDAIRTIREKAVDFFLTRGFPSIKNEEWRFTNMLPFLKDNYALDVQEQNLSQDTIDTIAGKVKEHLSVLSGRNRPVDELYRIVTINGLLCRELSVLPQEGLEVLSLASAKEHPLFQKYFGRIASEESYPDLNSLKFGKVSRQDGFSALNTALFEDGLMLVMPDRQVLDQPVYLINAFSSDVDMWLNPRHLIVLGKQAELNVIESVLPDNAENKAFVNSVTEIALDAQAHFHHYDIQTGRANMRLVQRTEATQQKHSNYSNYTFTFPGTDIVRNTLNIHLDQDEIESHLYGLYFSSDKQLIDNHTAVHHKFPRCESNQLYKGVMAGNSKGVFNGKIYVYEDAQKTNAFQQSSNILLSDKATIDAKPQLEIFADDVKASHGTTVGQLDKEALFYLRSRGIGEHAAKNMMINAFSYDVTQKVKDEPLKNYLEDIIVSKMQDLH